MATGKNRVRKQKREPKPESVKKSTPFKSKNNNNRTKKKKKNNNSNNKYNGASKQAPPTVIVPAGSLPPAEQLSYFLERFQSANGLKLSSLELDAIKDTCMLELSQGHDQDAESLSTHMKAAFGKSWKQVLCEGQLVDGEVSPGSPAVLTISTSALRSLELLRGVRPLTKECHAAKLFAKHMKVEEQVSILKNRVNIANGTPSRIKKLIDMDALGLSRLSVIVIDMHTDAKGYSLFTLPQVSDEFWDLYKSHFHHRIIERDLRICLYGPISLAREKKNKDDVGFVTSSEQFPRISYMCSPRRSLQDNTTVKCFQFHYGTCLCGTVYVLPVQGIVFGADTRVHRTAANNMFSGVWDGFQKWEMYHNCYVLFSGEFRAIEAMQNYLYTWESRRVSGHTATMTPEQVTRKVNTLMHELQHYGACIVCSFVNRVPYISITEAHNFNGVAGAADNYFVAGSMLNRLLPVYRSPEYWQGLDVLYAERNVIEVMTTAHLVDSPRCGPIIHLHHLRPGWHSYAQVDVRELSAIRFINGRNAGELQPVLHRGHGHV